MSAKFTGTEMLVVTAALEVVNSLLKIIANKLDNANGSDIEAMKQVLKSMKEAVDLQEKIKEAQDETNVNIDDWIDDSNE